MADPSLKEQETKMSEESSHGRGAAKFSEFLTG